MLSQPSNKGLHLHLYHLLSIQQRNHCLLLRLVFRQSRMLSLYLSVLDCCIPQHQSLRPEKLSQTQDCHLHLEATLVWFLSLHCQFPLHHRSIDRSENEVNQLRSLHHLKRNLNWTRYCLHRFEIENQFDNNHHSHPSQGFQTQDML